MGYVIIFSVIAVVAVGITLLSRVFFAGSVSFVKTKSKTVPAKILNKRKKDMLRASGVYTNFFMLFDLGNGDKLELPINKKLYKKDNLGKTGMLTYKGGIFVNFVLDDDLPTKPKKETYILNGEVVEK